MLRNTEHGVKESLTTQSVMDHIGLDGGWLVWVLFKPSDVLMTLRSGPSHCHMALGTGKLGSKGLWCVLQPLEGNNW